jgi:hypothetical protein
VQLPNNVSPFLVLSPGKENIFSRTEKSYFLFFQYSKSGAKCVSCAYKASAGLLYPLERGFIYITKPPIYIHHDDVASCGFNRSNTATGRTFDFEIQLKSGGSQVFSNIEK